MMAHLLHIRPWEMENLTLAEFESAIAWIEQELAARTN